MTRMQGRHVEDQRSEHGLVAVGVPVLARGGVPRLCEVHAVSEVIRGADHQADAGARRVMIGPRELQRERCVARQRIE